MTTKQQAWRQLAGNMERLKGEGSMPPVTIDCAIHDLREAADELDRAQAEAKSQENVTLDYMARWDKSRAQVKEAEAEIKALKSPKPRAMGVEYQGTNASYAGEHEGEG